MTSERLVFGGVLAAALVGAAALLGPKLAGPPPSPDEATGVAGPGATGRMDDDPWEDDAPPAPPATAPSVTAAATATATAPVGPAYVRPAEGEDAACGAEMALVDGIYCPSVGHTCERPRAGGDVCEVFAPDVFCEGRLTHVRACVDRYEYPNMLGMLPVVLVDFDDASRACAAEGKRLCTAEEWQFACEGTQMWPYEYGRTRDRTACNIDGAAVDDKVVDELLRSPARLSSEMPALDGRVGSGDRPRCVSMFGVHDLTGNVEEWVTNEAGKATKAPFRSALKGGSWSPSRAACRPTNTSHDATYRAVDVGFRCCKNPRGFPAKEAAPGARIPKRRRMKDAR